MAQVLSTPGSLCIVFPRVLSHVIRLLVCCWNDFDDSLEVTISIAFLFVGRI